MKYIRTEDAIYKKTGNLYIENDTLYQVGYAIGKIPLGQVIAQSDRIEELCDEFVVMDECAKYCLEIDSSYESLKRNNWLNGDYTVYGAIWTSQGLIYVAEYIDGVFYII